MIGTNKKDATETVELLLEDARAGKLACARDATSDALLDERGASYVEYDGLAGDRRRRARPPASRSAGRA